MAGECRGGLNDLTGAGDWGGALAGVPPRRWEIRGFSPWNILKIGQIFHLFAHMWPEIVPIFPAVFAANVLHFFRLKASIRASGLMCAISGTRRERWLDNSSHVAASSWHECRALRLNKVPAPWSKTLHFCHLLKYITDEAYNWIHVERFL